MTNYYLGNMYSPRFKVKLLGKWRVYTIRRMKPTKQISFRFTPVISFSVKLVSSVSGYFFRIAHSLKVASRNVGLFFGVSSLNNFTSIKMSDGLHRTKTIIMICELCSSKKNNNVSEIMQFWLQFKLSWKHKLDIAQVQSYNLSSCTQGITKQPIDPIWWLGYIQKI